MPAKIASTFGTKVRVCSCMLVTVWKMDIASPTTKEVRSSGAEVMIITYKVSLVICVTADISKDLASR